MNFKQTIPLGIVLLIIGLSKASLWCVFTTTTCYGSWVDKIYLSLTQPMDEFARYASIATVLVIFVSRPIYTSWARNSLVFLIVAAAFVSTMSVMNSGSLIDIYPYYRVDAARDAGIAFSVLTALFVAWKWYAERRKLRA